MSLKKENLFVSVIIPTFNRACVLERAIDSVLNQDFKNLEVIVVDDGSTDNTREILNKYGKKISVLEISNSGVSFARNVGIKAAKGNYIAFLDSDDYWKKKKLGQQIKALFENQDYRVIYTNEIWIRNGTRINQSKVHCKYGGAIYLKCLPLCIISPSSVLMQREIFDEIGLFDETLPACEDYDLWIRISHKFKIFFLDENLIYKTGGHEDQLSRKYWGMDRFRVKALLKMLSFDLSVEEKLATIDMIKKKCEILILGFEKRNNLKEAEQYRQILKTLIK